MFGHNQIHGQKSFAEAGDKLLVTSMFFTLQGEGLFAGRPAFFVRLAYCNLACSFCDTFFDHGDWYSSTEISTQVARRIKAFFNNEVPSWANWASQKRQMVLVVTGGEPMLQKNLTPFLEDMVIEFAQTQIESNGILLQKIPHETVLCISPKSREENGVPVGYIQPNYRALDRADYLKFVVAAPEQSFTYSSVPDWALRWRERTDKPIYVSPMNVYKRLPLAAQRLRDGGVQPTIEERSTIDEVVSAWEEGLLDREKNRANHEYAAQSAIRHGLYLTLQMHLYASVA